MADQKISQLTTIVTVDTASDLFPIVDTSAAETKKITPSALKTALSLNNVDNTSDANKPISSATQTALDGKVDENAAITGATKTKITYDAKGLVTAGADATTADIADSTNRRYVTDAQLVVVGNTSGTNTGDNATNSQYSGLATSKQDTLVSGTNIKTVNSTSLLGSGDVAVQATLVSGTNIKTINSTSLLGSGDIVISASPSGVSGAIQFSNGSAFASDAANFFWDDTNNRLGVGTNAPTSKVFIQGTEVQTSGTHLTIQGTGTGGFSFADSYATSYYSMYPSGVLASNRTYANYIINSSASGNDTAFNSTTSLNLQIGGVNKLGAVNNGINIVDRLTVNSSSVDTSARAVIKGSGSTSATTSFLVQNSAGTAALTVKDNLFIEGLSSSNQLNFRFGPTNQGISTRNGDFSIGFSDSTNIIGARLYSNGTGYFWIDGLTEGASKAQNYPIIFGSRAAATGTSVGSYTTEENGSQSYFGFYAAQPSAQVIVNSTTRGFLPPRMTTTQKNAIATPAAGLVVYDTTTNKLCCYNGSTWNDLF